MSDTPVCCSLPRTPFKDRAGTTVSSAGRYFILVVDTSHSSESIFMLATLKPIIFVPSCFGPLINPKKAERSRRDTTYRRPSHVGAIASYRRRYEYRSAASILGSTRHRPGGTGVSDGAVIPGPGAGVVE
jgi:hypothetical protein